jgi:hypothetical protein
MTVSYAPHPRAVMMPDLPEKKYQLLKAGIADHGLQHPIKVLKGTSLLLDGRHRLRACQELGVPLRVEEIDIPEDEVAIYTGAEATKRAGLTPTQKVLIAVELFPEFKRRASDRQRLGVKLREGEKGKAAERAASLVGVSARYVEFGLRLLRKHPELFERVRQGDLTLAAAQREAKGKEAKSKPKRLPNDSFCIPNYLRDRLVAATDKVGGNVLGDGVEALLDYIEGEGGKAWQRWATKRKNGVI